VRQTGDTYILAATGPTTRSARGQTVDSTHRAWLDQVGGPTSPAIGVVESNWSTPPPGLLPDVRSWVAVPLAARGVRIGVLVVGSSAEDTYTDAHLQIAAALAGQGMTAYDNACLFQQLNEVATTDSMTGLPNRRHFLDLAKRAFDGAPSSLLAGSSELDEEPLTAIMVDIDHFKQVNDTYGHLIGDEVIQEIGARLRSSLRGGELVGRYGGEEFAVVVAAAPEHSRQVAERLCRVVAASPVNTAVGPIPVTISVGTADRRNTDRTLGALLDRADQALYRAKGAGRNRVSAS
jgi:diguanylate cyclase (GGDEF)-like protein